MTNQWFIPCAHDQRCHALWRCMRSSLDEDIRPAQGKSADWAMLCWECQAFDIVPGEGARITRHSRGKMIEDDPRV